MYRMSWICLLTASFFVVSPALADVTECDRLAANPPDPDRVTEGVHRSEVDISAAIAACKDALVAEPGTARFEYQLGRVYFYGGNTPMSLKYMERAVGQGYTEAEFVMGCLIKNRREGVPYDICRVEDLWFRAAQKGHIYARVDYVRYVTKGFFSECNIQATPDKLKDFIKLKPTDTATYFLRLLVEDLKEDVAAYSAAKGDD